MIQKARAIFGRQDLLGRFFAVGFLISVTYLMERLLPLVAIFDQGWAVWWPTNGLTLALLLISRRRHWPFILLGVSIATVLGQPLGAGSRSQVACIAISNCIEVLIPAFMLPRFYTLAGWLQAPRLVWSFVLYAVLLGPAVSSVLMGGFYHLALHQAFWPIVWRWGLADVVGITISTPLILALISPDIYALFRMPQLPGTLSVMSLLVATSWFVFHQSFYPIAFFISPVLLLVAIRCGFSGSVLAMNIIAPIVTHATLIGVGPFALVTGVHEPYRIIVVQLFMILAMLMTFPISVARVQQESTAAQLQHAYLQMEALATADALTGLANRRRFDTALEAEWRRGLRDGSPVAVLMLDADNFKKYNDRYGHPAGDACLQAIAKAICDIPQRGGDLVARYGGEEFVILLPGIDAEGAYSLAEQVRYNVRMLDLPHEDNGPGRVTISVGCASLKPVEDLQAGALVEGSDRALYQAKKRGRNQSCIHRWQQPHTPEKRLRPTTEALVES